MICQLIISNRHGEQYQLILAHLAGPNILTNTSKLNKPQVKKNCKYKPYLVMLTENKVTNQKTLKVEEIQNYIVSKAQDRGQKASLIK